MATFFDNPLVQSALLPFVVTFVLAGIAGLVRPHWRGLSVVAGFYLSAPLITGAQLLPLTSTRKILVLGIVGLIVALLLSRQLMDARRRYFILLLLVSAAATWVLWPVLLRANDLSGLFTLAASVVYVIWLVVLLDKQRQQASTQLLSVLILAAGTAIVATLGASALLGQLSGALAAASGGLLLALLVLGKGRDDDLLLFPAVLLVGLVGLAAVVYASLNWQSLLCLMLIPLVSRLPLTLNNIWIKLFVQLLIMLPMVAGAAYLAWDTGSDAYY